MNKVSICICTKNRKEGLIRLLGSINRIRIDPDTMVRIIIVENNKEFTIEKELKDFSSGSHFKIDYYLEPREGLVFARNRSVKEAGDCDFCCFTDDDEIVSEEWLLQLLKCQKEFDADGVAGPTFPVFGDLVPVYIRNYHMPDTYPYGTIVSTAFTGCLLIRKKYLDQLEGPFDERLNFTGGEDINMTQHITDLGGVIRFNPEATAFEEFSGSRTTIRYIIKRAYKTSNTGLYARSFGKQGHYKLKALPRLILRFGYGMLILIPVYLAGGENKLKGLIKIVNAVGGFHFIMGRTNKFYK